MRYLGAIFRSLRFLQGLELIDPLLGVALTDLTQGLVLVAAGPDVLGVEQIVVGLLVVVSGFCQLRAQGLWREETPVTEPQGHTGVYTASTLKEETDILTLVFPEIKLDLITREEKRARFSRTQPVWWLQCIPCRV